MIDKSLFTFQSYFMGCAFDSFSTSWSDRSYVITLLVLAWLIPLVIICLSYVSIIFRVRISLQHIKQLTNVASNSCITSGPTRKPSWISRSARGSRRDTEGSTETNSSLDKNVEQRVSSHSRKLVHYVLELLLTDCHCTIILHSFFLFIHFVLSHEIILSSGFPNIKAFS